MIPRILPGRNDKRSSFKKLTNYIIEGLEAAGGDISMVSFHDLTRYIVAETALDGMGKEVEKTLAVEIGHLMSLRTAAEEMWAVASQNSRVDDPILHYMLSWPEHERPPVKDVLDAARRTLAALGLSEHQYIIAIHVNTDNLHAHVEVNRVHPVTFKSHHIEWAHKTLHRAAREIEIDYGWFHDKGLYVVVEVDGQKRIVEGDHKLPEQLAAPKTRAAIFEEWSGTQSFETWCKDEPATDLKTALEAGKLTSWEAVHGVLAGHHVELQTTGGGYRVINRPADGAPSDTGAAASRVFRFLKPADLEAKLGKFRPYDPATVIVADVPAGRGYKRDPLKRLVRRLDRKEAREDLFRRYEAEKKRDETERYTKKRELKRAALELNRQRHTALRAAYLKAREELKADTKIPAAEKQRTYVLMRLKYEQDRAALAAQIAVEQKEIARILPRKPSWRAWLEIQAQAGDPAAISALRGLAYRERRSERGDGEAPEGDEQRPTLAAAELEAEDEPTIRPIQQLEWHVTNNGRIFYSFPSKDEGGRRLAFIDEGSRIAYARPDVSDRALRASLEYAKMKWGPNLRLNGGDEIFRRRVIETALSVGMRVQNPELQAYQAKLLAAQLTFNREEAPHGRSNFDRITPNRARAGHRAAALRQSASEQHGFGRPAESLAGVRHLSGLGLVHDQRVAEMLLPRHAPDHLGQHGKDGPADPAMRRTGNGANQAHGKAGAAGRTGSVTRQDWTAREIEKLRHGNPAMRIQDAAHQVAAKEYLGKVLAVTDTHVLQQTAKDQVTLHDLKRLQVIPKAKQNATIRYRDGMADVRVTRTKGKGR